MSDINLAYRVIGWDDSHETPQSLKKQGQRADVLLPTNLGTTAIQALMRSPEGPAVMGVWCVVQMLAANASRRGVLCEQGSPLTADQLARVTGWDVSLIERALTLLCQPGTRYLERVPLDIALQPPVLPEPKPRTPRKPKPLPFTHCPNCNADLQACANGACRHPVHRVQPSSDAPVVDAASVREKQDSSENINPHETLAQPTSQCQKVNDMISYPQTGCELGGGDACRTALDASDDSRTLAASATADCSNLVSGLLAQARGLFDDDADDFRNRNALVPNYDDGGRRAELASLSELMRHLESGQVNPQALDNYLESHNDRVARQGEEWVASAPPNKSPPAQVPRQSKAGGDASPLDNACT